MKTKLLYVANILFCGFLVYSCETVEKAPIEDNTDIISDTIPNNVADTDSTLNDSIATTPVDSTLVEQDTIPGFPMGPAEQIDAVNLKADFLIKMYDIEGRQRAEDQILFNRDLIVVYDEHNGQTPDEYYYDEKELMLMNVPVGENSFWSEYLAPIPEGHQVATASLVHEDDMSYFSSASIIEQIRNEKEAIMNFRSEVQYQNVDANTTLDVFNMHAKNGRIIVGISYNAPSTKYYISAIMKVYNKHGKEIFTVNSDDIETTSSRNEYGVGLDFTDPLATTGAFVIIDVSLINTENESDTKSWTLDGQLDERFKIENGISKGISIDIDNNAAPKLKVRLERQ
ncbi:hypothetical protein [Flammeovirga agarivorans]|uniref:Lipoprotein n=1 Tax=Flammeovirga agarivorans TaxID=2726742 RepID=A0A7X8SP83_9BACT|nr:hypothetical protein [Flammeovirga agarivorans]NLR93870.1 hypothetical protein [Flammeovirga agarivorans]